MDFLLADKALALEAKASPRVHEGHTKGLLALAGDGPVKRSIIVCLESEPRTLANGIEIAPWKNFIQRLWAGEFLIGVTAQVESCHPAIRRRGSIKEKDLWIPANGTQE